MATEESKLIIAVDSTSAVKAQAELDKLTASSAKAEAATSKLGKAAGTAGADLGTAAAKTEALSESAAQAQARIHAMVQASLKQAEAARASAAASDAVAASDSAAAEAQAAATASTQASIAAARQQTAQATAQIGEMSRLEAILAQKTMTTAEQTEAQTLLNKVNERGMLLDGELAAMTSQLAKARIVDAAAAETEAAAAATLNSRVSYEFGTALGELASGNVSRLKRTGAALANQMGLLQKLMSPVGLGILGIVGAIGALAVAFAKGQGEQSAYASALSKTGDYAQLTVGQLGAMAKEMDALPGVTQHAAAGVLALVVATGQLSGPAVEMVAKAALQMEALGQKTDVTVKTFEQLGKDPVKALGELAASTHLVSANVIAEVSALQQRGESVQAAAVAQKAYADAVQTQSAKTADNLGTLQKEWGKVKTVASEAWDAMMGVGRTETPESRIASLDVQIEAARKQFAAIAQTPNLAAQQVQAGGELVLNVNRQTQLKNAQDSLNALLAARTKLQQSLFSAADINNGTQGLGASLAGIGAWAAQNAPPVDALRAKLADLANKERDITIGLGTGQLSKQAGAQYLSTIAYQRALINKQIDDIDAKSQAQTPSQKLQANVSNFVEKSIRNVTKAQDAQVSKQIESTQAADRYNASLKDMLATQQKQIDLQVQSVGMSDQEIQRRDELIAIDKKYDDDRLKLTFAMEGATDASVKASYATRLSDLAKFHDDEIAMTKDGWKRLDAARQNALNGITRGLEQVVEGGTNQAAQATNIVTQGFSDLTDAVVNFAQTGKFSLKQFGDDFVAMMLRMELSAVEAKAADAILGLLGGGTSSGESVSINWSGGASTWEAKKSANGNVFDGPGIAAFANRVVSKPTRFYAYGGNVMGEAGPEAIMPLTRGPNGKLGVQASGSGDVDVVVNITNNGQPVQATQTSQQRNGKQVIVGLVLDTVANDLASGGKTAKAIQGRFGLQRRGLPAGV